MSGIPASREDGAGRTLLDQEGEVLTKSSEEYGFKDLPPISWKKGDMAMDLTRDEQSVLTLANLVKAAIKSGNVLNPKNAAESWLKYHWAGHIARPEDVPARKKHFADSMATYKSIY